MRELEGLDLLEERLPETASGDRHNVPYVAPFLRIGQANDRATGQYGTCAAGWEGWVCGRYRVSII